MALITDPDAAEQKAALPMPTAGDVLDLQESYGYPAVSVLCSTEPALRMARADSARLLRLVSQAAERLTREFGAGGAAAACDQLRELADDAMDRATRSAVALFVGPGGASSWSLPVRVRDRAVVDPTFATRDLVRALHRTPRHVVLVVTEREARLFDGVGDALLPAVGGAFPLERVARGDGRQRAGRGRRPDRGGDAGLDPFLRAVDQALGAYLSLHPAPLVLVGASRTLSRFTALSRNTGRLAGCIPGSHVRTPLPELARLIRPVLEDYLRSRESEALALLDRRTSAGRAVTGLQAVWLAARTERPEMLVVEEGLFQPARLSRDGDLLTPADDVEHPDVIDDAVDEVIEIVLRRGGWIALADDGALAGHDRIALTVLDR